MIKPEGSIQISHLHILYLKRATRRGHVGHGTVAVGERDPVGLEEAPLHDLVGVVVEAGVGVGVRVTVSGFGFGLGLGFGFGFG